MFEGSSKLSSIGLCSELPTAEREVNPIICSASKSSIKDTLDYPSKIFNDILDDSRFLGKRLHSTMGRHTQKQTRKTN